MKLTFCKSCRAAIAFVRLPSGRRLPINPTPNDRLFDNAATSPTYTSHLATCPNANQHRRSR